MKDYKLIPKIALWSLMAIGVIVSVLFYLPVSEGTLEVAGDFLNIPRFSNLFLVWNYILVCLVVLITLGVVCWEFVKTYKVDKVKIIGYEGQDNVGPMAKLSDACLYLTYILICATIVALVWGVIHTKRMK